MEAKFQCPKCERPIVSCRNKRCLYCGAELPVHLLFTKAEVEALDRECLEDEKRRKVREEETRKNAGGDNAGVDISF